MTFQYLMPVLGLVAYAVYFVWIKGKTKQMKADSRPACQMYMDRTGYRYADMAPEPIEPHLDRMVAGYSTAERDEHLVRNFHGIPVHYRSSYRIEQKPGKTVHYQSNQWDADVTAPPRIPVHIADKGLASMLKSVKEAFGNSKRHFNPKCSQKVTTGIPSIDDKYVVFAESQEAAQYLFQNNPALVQGLQNWAEVDVWITANGATFNDPTSQNMTAAMGGTVGNMAMGFDMMKRTEMMIPTHDRIAELLATLVRATA